MDHLNFIKNLWLCGYALSGVSLNGYTVQAARGQEVFIGDGATFKEALEKLATLIPNCS
jgi:hypothetical protein